MLNKPINNIVKEHFNKMREIANEKANTEFEQNILNKIKGLNHFQTFSICINERKRIKKLLKKDPHPYYINNSDDWLLNQFANRHFLLNVDETNEFIQSVYLSDYSKLIYRKIEDLEKDIPKYTYNDFLNGVQNKYLENFAPHYSTEEKDYYKIVDWQMKSLLDIVQYDSRNIIRAYQNYCKTINNPLEFIIQELSILDDELSKKLKDAKVLKQILSKLYLFKSFDFNSYNDELLISNYPLFFNNKNNLNLLNPINLKEPLQKKENGTKSVIGNEYTIFYSLDIVLKWMRKIIKGDSFVVPFEFKDIDEELKKAFQETEEETDKEIETLNNFCYNDESNSDEQIKKYLREQLQTQIDTYNKFEDKKLFFLLRDENIELLKENIRFNYILNDKLDEIIQNIKKAKRILNISWEIAFIFNELFDSRTMYFKNDTGSHYIIQSLMNKMVVDKEIYSELQSVLDGFFERFHSDSVPMDFHFLNHREAYIRLFEKSMSRFQEILNNAEPSNKVIYIQSRLKELKHRELKFRSLIDRREDFKDKEDKYPNLFKEFLTIEAEFIKETATITPLSFIPDSTTLLIEESNNKDFESLLTEERQVYVLKLLEDMSLTLNGKYNLTERKKGAIRGVVEALKENHILPDAGLDILCKSIGSKIGLEIKSKLDVSNTSNDFKKGALQYIKDNPLH